ncbi:hypothetical protein SAMN04488077_11537 [Roseovarius tolerans]|uniref:DUF2846 domain-containing protein n=2 Tax=Roseovarius tolerans TaxID=74031 RepID=A0A1H8FI87_9RHOB|nr:hypothetical protein SAMN04488077_11537 [Roseovarius tolerans]
MTQRLSIRPLALMLALLFGGVPVLAESGQTTTSAQPPAGLLWNRTGLPAVFPLQVKTPPGPDYHLTLIDTQTGEAALAAYIEGGAFFRVLVPPGTFRLRFATGTEWQGEDVLFGQGEATHRFDLRRPLTFETRGLGTKAGHIVTLTPGTSDEITRAARKDQFICQSFRPGFASPARSPLDRRADQGPRGKGDLIDGEPMFHEPLARPRHDVRSRYCG